ncbi:MAG: AAA family ATPase [Spirochaetota bacterium]|nr:MAG: AAA family ATPase [Spirochaetota bacterium]
MERMIFSEMVGREKELDKLELHVFKVINDEGTIVNVIGEAGIGKSRLIAELRRKDEMKKVVLLEGRASSIGKNLSYHPIIEILKNWAGIKEDDSELESLNKLERSIKEVNSEGVSEIFPFVASLMGMELKGKYEERVKDIEGEALSKLILKNLKDLLIKISEIKPLVIIFEDLHWNDLSTLELLESLFRLVEKNRVLFINVFRPRYEETGERLIKTIKDRYNDYYSEINLHPLDDIQSDSLVLNLLQAEGIPQHVRQQIKDKSEGNPFYIEEIIRKLIDDDVVEIKKGKFEVTDKIDSVVIPASINELIMSRIDRLDEETKDLLKVASIIGRSFFYKIIADVAKNISEIDRRIDHLKNIQLIRERKRLAEIEYLFKHVIAQEAIYKSILLKKRKELHLTIAQAIVSVFQDKLHDFYGMLAYHYSQAEDLDKTEEYLIKAGETALKTSASTEALHYYKTALELYVNKCGDDVDKNKIAELEKNIASALYNKGQFVEAIEYFDRVLSHYGMPVPKTLLIVVCKFIAGFINLLISLYLPLIKWKKNPTKLDNEIINLYFKKLQSTTDIDPKKLVLGTSFLANKITKYDISKVVNGIEIITSGGGMLTYSGLSFSLSKKVFAFIKDKIDKNDMRTRLYYELNHLIYDLFIGHWQNIKYHENVIDSNMNVGELFYTTNYIWWHGLLTIELGNFKRALELVKKLSEISTEYEHDFSVVKKYHLSSKFLMKYRKYDNALIEIDNGIEIIKKTDFRLEMLTFLPIKARILLMHGDKKGAEQLLLKSKEMADKLDLTPSDIINYLVCQFVFNICQLEESMKTGNKPNFSVIKKITFKCGKNTVKMSKKIALDLTESLKLLGTYYWLIGKQKKALKWWTESIHEGERLGAKLELSRTYYEVGKRLSEPKSKHNSLKGIKSEEYLEKAKSMFEEMELQWDLNELERVRMQIDSI